MGRHVTNHLDSTTVRRYVRIDEPSGCWLWTGPIADGVGCLEVCGTDWLAHRLAWFLEHQRHPGDILVHTCGVALCVNPAHLSETTHKARVSAAIDAGRFDPMAVSRHSHKPRQRKLTDDAIRDIRAGADTDAAYAVRYGVARSTVFDVRKRKTKRHVID